MDLTGPSDERYAAGTHHPGTVSRGHHPRSDGPQRTRRHPAISRTVLIASGIAAALLAVGVVAFIGAHLAQRQPVPTNGVAAAAKFNNASIAATGSAKDGDLHSTARDRHTTRSTADHNHPNSHNAHPTSTAR